MPFLFIGPIIHENPGLEIKETDVKKIFKDTVSFDEIYGPYGKLKNISYLLLDPNRASFSCFL